LSNSRRGTEMGEIEVKYKGANGTTLDVKVTGNAEELGTAIRAASGAALEHRAQSGQQQAVTGQRPELLTSNGARVIDRR